MKANEVSRQEITETHHIAALAILPPLLSLKVFGKKHNSRYSLHCSFPPIHLPTVWIVLLLGVLVTLTLFGFHNLVWILFFLFQLCAAGRRTVGLVWRHVDPTWFKLSLGKTVGQEWVTHTHTHSDWMWDFFTPVLFINGLYWWKHSALLTQKDTLTLLMLFLWKSLIYQLIYQTNATLSK